VGANSADGKDVDVIVEALTEGEALETARRRGVFVSSVSPIRQAVRRPVHPPVPPTIGGGKLFVIVTGAVTCGLTIALICYALFFAAAGGRKPLADSRLGVEEQALMKEIGAGSTDGVREYLVKPLNWSEVATPALELVMAIGYLQERRYASDHDKHERQFWLELSERLIRNGADVDVALQLSYDIESLRFLIARKANVNSTNVLGNTALHRLTSDTWDGSVALLIDSGANVNAVGYNGDTPLHLAAKEGAVKVINRLLHAGANINARNEAGQTPLAIANLAMRKEAAAVLRLRGGTE
jgi:hypothetical protein